MWINELFGGKKPVIGMVHLDALPGSIRYDEQNGLDGVISHAEEDFNNLVEGGIDGVIFCNEWDKPYSKDVGKEVVASMTAIIHKLTANKASVPFGVDILWDTKAALAVALSTNATFVRGVVCGVYCGDLGIYSPDVEQVMRYRHAIGADNVKVLTNLMPEFSSSLDGRPLELVAQSVVRSSLVDGVCVSGVMAGKAAPYQQLKHIKAVLENFPVLANTGVTFDTVDEILAVADACIVATCIKVDGQPENRIESARVKKLMRRLESK